MLESWFWFTAIFSSSGSVPVLCVDLGNYLLNVVEGQARNLRHIETHLQRAVGGKEVGKQVKGWMNQWMNEGLYPQGQSTWSKQTKGVTYDLESELLEGRSYTIHLTGQHLAASAMPTKWTKGWINGWSCYNLNVYLQAQRTAAVPVINLFLRF